MIEVTRLDGQQMVINGDQVEKIEAIPDTIISLTSGRKVIVRESVAELLQRLMRYRSARRWNDALPLSSAFAFQG